MTQQAIRGAFQTRLLTLGWADQTAFEDKFFKPSAGVAYQIVNAVFAAPNDYSLGASFLERGFFQIRLMYPQNTGVGVSSARAEAIRALFPRALHLTNSAGQRVAKVMSTAEITRLEPQGDRDVAAIRIRFSDR